MSEVMHTVRDLPLPVPLGGLPVPGEWRARTRPARRDRTHPEPQRLDPVPLGLLTINAVDEARAAVTHVVAGEERDVVIALQLDSIPAFATHLVLQHSCRLPPSDYHFPEGEIALTGTKSSYTLDGTMRFLYPQTQGSTPIELELRAIVRGPGGDEPVELFGDRTLAVRIHASHASEPGAPPAPAVVVLTPTEEEQNRIARYRVRLPLEVTAGRVGDRNVVRLGEVEVHLANAEFKAFMLLVLGGVMLEGGWLSRATLRRGDLLLGLEGAFFPQGIDQSLSRIRAAFIPALHGIQGTEFIEASQERVRPSLHPRFLRYDLDQLLKHPNADVRSVADALREYASRHPTS